MDVHGGGEIVERALVSLTPAWSFAEQVDVPSLSRRSPHDLVVALETFQGKVLSNLHDQGRRAAAEGLFAGLISGGIPPQFADVHIMEATGWDWPTLQETPADVVQEMVLYLAVKRARAGNASLEFDYPEEQQDGG